MNFRKYIQARHFTIQWHITERCNWSCKHCYREYKNVKELSFSNFRLVVRRCLELFKTLRLPRERTRLNIGGGEPFLRKDLFELLKFLNKHKDSLVVQIMTNGSLITEEIAQKLKRLPVVSGVQISLEGLAQSNDAVRGKGAFEKAVRGIRLLRKHNIYTRVSSTLTKSNIAGLEDFIAYLKRIGVSGLGIRRYVPMGWDREFRKQMLSPVEQEAFYSFRSNLKKKFDEPGKFIITHNCEDGIAYVYRDNHFISKCAAVEGNHLNIFSNGDILVCRRFPIVVGNVLKESLLDVYFSSEVLWSLRNQNNAYSACRKCPYFLDCLGGAKCVTYAYFRNAFAPDPQCPRLFKKLPNPNRYKNTSYVQEKVNFDRRNLPNRIKDLFKGGECS